MAMSRVIERYVRDERARGAGEDSIRHALIGKGWDPKVVDDALEETRPGSVGSLFTPTFFRFAFGFAAVIVMAVGLILMIGTISDSGKGSACIVNCTD